MSSTSARQWALAAGLVLTFPAHAGEPDAKEPTVTEKLLVPSADRNAPAPVPPVVVGGLRLEAPASDIGVLVARDAASGKEQWRVRVVDRWVDKRLEADVQDVYIRSLSAGDGAALLEDEAGIRYSVELKSHKLRILTWPVALRWVAWRPSEKGWRYSVELTVTNTLNRVLKLDEPSVARGGELSNNLFRVTAGGKDVGYHGMMAKRGPPSRFIELKPGQSHRVTVELGEEYPLPPGRHHVTVAFEHTNHFSPDGFTMTSPALQQDFDGDGWTATPKPRP